MDILLNGGSLNLNTEERNKTMTEPRIYIADLAAYNNGILHGTRIDATLDLDDIRDQIHNMLKASPIEGAEEHGKLRQRDLVSRSSYAFC